jgi:type I restriction enzyme S subunit
MDISDIITGCAQPKLTQANLNNINVFDIPLNLQHQFASKIEAIERQKELIKQSISETETLFNERMQLYFN